MNNKELFKDKYRIQSARLYGYDYSWPGYYFITICTKDRINYFGEIIKYRAVLSEIGEIAQKYWQEIPSHYPFVQHGIIIICPAASVETYKSENPTVVETQDFASLPIRRPDFASLPVNHNYLTHHNKFIPQSKNLSSIIRGYKIGVKKNASLHNIEFVWQERFYDRIIRNKEELKQIEQYIKDNPKTWGKDRNNLNNVC